MTTEINERLKIFRLALKMNQTEFAKTFGISRSYLSEIEAGKTKPSIDLLIAISKHREANPRWLDSGLRPKFLEPNMRWILNGKGNVFLDDFSLDEKPDSELIRLREMLDDIYYKGTDKERWMLLGFLKELSESVLLKRNINNDKNSQAC